MFAEASVDEESNPLTLVVRAVNVNEPRALIVSASPFLIAWQLWIAPTRDPIDAVEIGMFDVDATVKIVEITT